MKLGDLIKRYREEHGYSQRKMAALMKCSYAYVSMLEKGINPKNQREVSPSIDIFKRAAEAMGMDIETLIRTVDSNQPITLPASTPAGLATQTLRGKRIPVYGSIVAGIPIEAIEDIEDWEEIPQDWPGEFFALRVRGRSMEPKYVEGDTVILRRADDVESGRTAAVLIGRESATLKRVIKSREGVTLVAYNPDVYEPHFYSNDDVLSLPLQIIGDVIELRRKV